MAISKAATVSAYLADLPPDRRKVLAAVRSVIRKNLPRGYRESMGYGMICYSVPLKRYPDTYNGQPLCYAALAAQKNYYALYLMSVYGDTRRSKAFRSAFGKAGKKLDMGKSCVRFKTLNDLPLDVISREIASTPVDAFIASFERSHPR
jgi:Domain of unknown function (DU1801)